MNLSDYLDQAGRGAMTRMAKEVGVSVVTVLRWRRGEAAPSWDRIPAIERATGNAVTAADFVPRTKDAA
jgi:DNA-binding transcriptional regulator YdaS (Cro superfamily)